MLLNRGSLKIPKIWYTVYRIKKILVLFAFNGWFEKRNKGNLLIKNVIGNYGNCKKCASNMTWF